MSFALRKQIESERKKRRLIYYTIFLLLFLYFIGTGIFGDMGLIRYVRLKHKKTQMKQDIAALDERKTRLKTDLKLLQENPFYMEKYARENFGMAKSDEYIFTYDNR